MSLTEYDIELFLKYEHQFQEAELEICQFFINENTGMFTFVFSFDSVVMYADYRIKYWELSSICPPFSHRTVCWQKDKKMDGPYSSITNYNSWCEMRKTDLKINATVWTNLHDTIQFLKAVNVLDK